MSCPIHSLFRIRFTYSDNGVVYSRVALVRAVRPDLAKDRLCKWLLKTIGPKPDFAIKSCQYYRDVNIVIGYESYLKCGEDLPPDSNDPLSESILFNETNLREIHEEHQPNFQ